jgi:integral membrane protein (TIGR01906 family)
VPERLAALATALAAAFVVVAIAILPFMTPAWVSFEQGRAQAAAWTGYSEAELSAATNAIIHDLVLGPPDFAVAVDGAPVLSERERAHMRDVRGVFAAFFALAAVAAAGLAVLYAGARRRGHAERAWSAISLGMRGLIVGVVLAGLIAAVAFDQAFEVFHTVFFPAGSFTFDPRTDRLVQLLPFTFWSETTIVVGGVIVGLAAILAVVTGRLAGRAAAGAREAAPREQVPASTGAEAAR